MFHAFVVLVGCVIASGSGPPSAAPLPQIALSEIKLEVATAKQAYKVGEEIALDVRIVSDGRFTFSVEGDFARTWNLGLVVNDVQGKSVHYPEWNMTLRRIPPHSATGFVLIEPGKYFGDMRAMTFRLEEPGTYSVVVNRFPAVDDEFAKEHGVKYFLMMELKAKPITVVITAAVP